LYDTLIFDLDGVIYRGNQATPYAVETLAWLRQHGRRIFWCTNNSSRSRRFFAEKILGLGIEAQAEEVMTSAYCCALWFQAQQPPRPVVFVVGEQGLCQELEAVGARVVRKADWGDQHIDYVVAGIDRGVTYDDLSHAHQAICAGAHFIATNRDSTFPVEQGTIPGAGAIVAAIATSTGMQPLLIGKPEPTIIQQILARSSTLADRALVIGDRLDTDIVSGKRAGVAAALVLTGIATREDAELASGDCRPDFVFDDLRGLRELLSR